MRQRILSIVPILILAAVTIVTRVTGIDRILVGDEAASFMFHYDFPWKEIFSRYEDITNHGLFTVLANSSVALLGEKESVFRLPALLAGILSVPILYWIGISFMESRFVALLTAFLLALSVPHIQYSQEGRAYSLTVFCGLLLFSAATWILRKQSMPVEGLLIFSGIAMVLCVPSNVFFVLAVAVFYLIHLFRRDTRNFPDALHSAVRPMLPFLILFVWMLQYFITVREGLELGLASYQNYSRLFEGADLSISLKRLRKTWDFLAQPWGALLGVFAVIGFIPIYKKGRAWPFVCLFAIPTLLVLVSKSMGPPRAYIYWLPFILLLAASGAEQVCIWSAKVLPEKLAPWITACLLAGFLFFGGRAQRQKDFPAPPLSTIEDAMAVSAYIRKETSQNDLIVVPYKDNVLHRYADDLIGEKILNILKTGEFGKIILIGHNEISPLDILMSKTWLEPSSFPLKESNFVSHRIGNLKIHVSQLKNTRFIPSIFDPDYETQLGLTNATDRSFTVNKNADSKFIGNYSLELIKKAEPSLPLFSPIVKEVEIKTDDVYILTVFARKYRYQRGTHVSLFSIGEPSPAPIYLNFFAGIFNLTPSGPVRKKIHPHRNFFVVNEGPARFPNTWQIIFSLTPFPKGRHRVTERLLLQEEQNYFDGIRFYLLYE